MVSFTGSLWTGRIYDYKKIREIFPNIIQICVMRWPPKYLDLKKEGIQHMLSFAPSMKLLNEYKKQRKDPIKDDFDEAWFMFIRGLYDEFSGNALVMEDRFKIRRALQDGESVVLLCHEKAGENCHRMMLPYIILTDDEMTTYKGEMGFEPAVVQTKFDWW